ncbi:hypothetical protein Ciccas_001837 [Cichlidogyrus casuarinus]|uniref:ATP synthase F(0) complex subunit e, mitochondrial n=1 Tax=Cichlidogyrus casuarinus TaxID=1844966 RepID=A0ABD2QIX5_9PLAT
MTVYDYKLPPPREVSPLIRTARWGLLGLGIVYGAVRLSYLSRREEKINIKNQEIAKRRINEHEIWFKEKSEKDMLNLAKEAGIVPKPI